MLPTIADALDVPALAAGDPLVLTGADALDRPVRWVHVAPPSGGRRLLLGGELLLATGVGWPTGPELTDYVEDLVAADVAALVLELGGRYAEAPEELVTACSSAGLPLVVLRREVRFVSITEALHSRIIDGQSAALRERDRVHGVFAELNRRGCSTGFLLDQAARMLGKPVVLEDLNHRVVVWSPSNPEPAALFSDWAALSRRAAQDGVASPAPYERTRLWAEGGWLRTPVEAQGRRWGTLVALECPSVPEAAEVVLENAALALSLTRLSGRGEEEWATLGQRHLLESLLTGSYVSLADLRTTFEAAGLRVVDRDLVAVARRTHRGAVTDHLAQVRARAAGLDVDVLCSPWADDPQSTALFVLSFRRARPDRDDALLALLEGSAAEPAAVPSVVAVGPFVSSFGDVLPSAEDAISLLQSTPLRSPERTVVHRSRPGALDLLLSRRRTDPELQLFVERVLGPLLEHDATRQHGGLIAIARACVQHPTNRKRAAAACHLSRSVFYQRIKVIEELLGADLDDGRTLAALHVALVAYGQRLDPL